MKARFSKTIASILVSSVCAATFNIGCASSIGEEDVGVTSSSDRLVATVTKKEVAEKMKPLFAKRPEVVQDAEGIAANTVRVTFNDGAEPVIVKATDRSKIAVTLESTGETVLEYAAADVNGELNPTEQLKLFGTRFQARTMGDAETGLGKHFNVKKDPRENAHYAFSALREYGRLALEQATMNPGAAKPKCEAICIGVIIVIFVVGAIVGAGMAWTANNPTHAENACNEAKTMGTGPAASWYLTNNSAIKLMGNVAIGNALNATQQILKCSANPVPGVNAEDGSQAYQVTLGLENVRKGACLQPSIADAAGNNVCNRYYSVRDVSFQIPYKTGWFGLGSGDYYACFPVEAAYEIPPQCFPHLPTEPGAGPVLTPEQYATLQAGSGPGATPEQIAAAQAITTQICGPVASQCMGATPALKVATVSTDGNTLITR